MNKLMDRMIKWLEGKNTENKAPRSMPVSSTPQPLGGEFQKKTALQVINEMVKARLTQPEVDILDDQGVRGEGTIPSPEFKLLQERGLRVLSANIGSLRLNPVIEETIINRWSATWLSNAKAEKEQIERRKNIIELAGQEKAIRQYADLLSHDLIQRKPVGVKDTLKTLLLRTRTIIYKNDQLRKRMIHSQDDLEEILKWIEEHNP